MPSVSLHQNSPPLEPLLSRVEFRVRALARDGYACVLCGANARAGAQLSVHHIMERRLFADGGYRLSNAVCLCDDNEGCHLRAERTLITPDELRAAAGITTRLLPPGLDDDLAYDKWGNAVLPDGRRAPGPLFHDSSVQGLLADAGVLDEFELRFKHPRTIHLPWSKNRGADGDHAHESTLSFEGRAVVATLKLDGENTSMTRDHIHARSLDSGYHHTRTWVTSLHGRIRHEIPAGWRVVGENMYGQHSIAYDALPSYFLVFAIFDESNQCLSWDDTVEWAALLGLDTVPVIFRGSWDESTLRGLQPSALYASEAEGYVVRWEQAFSYYQWHLAVGKSVRAEHVKDTVKHWRTAHVPANKLKRDAS